MFDCTAPVLAIDGRQCVGTYAAEPCCPPSVCNINHNALACSFIDQLPEGPLWDEAKARAKESLRGLCEHDCLPLGCNAVVAHAVYSARRLSALIKGDLIPMLHELSPYTANATLDDWLVRLGWQECIKCACGCVDPDAGETLPPWQLIMPDGSTVCCPSEADWRLTHAVKRGIVMALWRMRLQPVATLDAINAIITSLGARLVVDPVQDDPCCRPAFIVQPSSDVLPCYAPPPCRVDTVTLCDGTVIQLSPDDCTVQAYWELTCDGLGDNRRIYPGVIAAVCIARSILSHRHVKITF